MAKHELIFTDEQEAGITYARALHNASHAEQFATNTAFLQSINAFAADGWSAGKVATDDPKAAIAKKDLAIAKLKAEKAVLEVERDAKA